MKLNLLYSVGFNTSKHTVGNIILTFIHVLHEILFENSMENVPSQARNVFSLPHCFSNYRNCRIVLDCTKFHYKIPKRLDKQKDTYSSYKHHNTSKGFIGIAPNRTTTYASKLYPGSASDKAIVLDIFKAGNLILANKGFLLDDIVPEYVSVNVPPFLYASQFTPNEIEKTQHIARARIQVERVIRSLNLYHILGLIPGTLYKYSTKIYRLCNALTNYQNPSINKVASSYKSLNSDISHYEEDSDVESLQ